MADHSFHQNRINRKEEVEKAYSTKIMKNNDQSVFTPYVPAEKKLPEMTVTSLVIGILLAIVFGAANAYLGLRVGMTVSASIPATVISLAVTRVLLKRNSVLESNLVQTIGSAGESVAGGVIFTIPVLFLWSAEGRTESPALLSIALIALCGGMLGVLFMVLCLLMAVIAFFMILFTNKHPKSKLMVIFDCLSVACSVVSAVMFTLAGKTAAGLTAFNLGDIPMYNAHGGVMWGYFVALALLCVALGANFLVARAPAKSHEQLEEERLAKKAAKEEKERLNEIKKQKAMEEAEKAAAEEQKRIVEEARAKLAAGKEKKSKKKD